MKSKIVQRKAERILSKFDLDQDQMDMSEVKKMASMFEQSMQLLYDEYKIARDLSENAENDIRKYLGELKDKNTQLSYQAKLAGIGEMSAGISHEINTPLMIISSNLERIRLCFNKEKDNLKEDKYIQKIEKSIAEGKKTVDKITKIIKALKKISTDPTNVEKVDTNIIDVVEESISLYNENYKKKCVSLTLNNKLKNNFIKSNEIVMIKVFSNLLQNALDAVEELPSECHWVNIDIKECQDNIYFRFENGGGSIPSEISKKIFDPFFTTKPVNKGTGLGLRICRQYMSSLGGSIVLEEKDHPSFLVTIPKSMDS